MRSWIGVGIAYEDSQYDFTYDTPTAGGWEMGDRTIDCLIGGSEPVTGTLRGAGE